HPRSNHSCSPPHRTIALHAQSVIITVPRFLGWTGGGRMAIPRLLPRQIAFAILPALVFLSACGAPRCPPGAGQSMQIHSLYFGRSVAGRAEVSDQEWRDFREQVITPALPDGYTVVNGQGAWMNP